MGFLLHLPLVTDYQSIGYSSAVHHPWRLHWSYTLHLPNQSTSSFLLTHPFTNFSTSFLQYDFSSLAPILFIGIWGLLTTYLIQIFLPFNATVDLGIACFSTLLFSGFVLYDTQQIMKRLSVDEAIAGALTLYLDFLNLFLSILRVVSCCQQWFWEFEAESSCYLSLTARTTVDYLIPRSITSLNNNKHVDLVKNTVS